MAAALLLLVSAVLIPQKEVRADDPAQVVVTVYPAYDWIRNILGEEATDVEVTWLFDNGVDPHSYQPSVEDIMRIASCDLFVYVGGVSDQWVQEALAGYRTLCSRYEKAKEAYAAAAARMAMKRTFFEFLIGNLKCAVSNDVTSKPTKAQGARMIRLKTA